MQFFCKKKSHRISAEFDFWKTDSAYILFQFQFSRCVEQCETNIVTAKRAHILCRIFKRGFGFVLRRNSKTFQKLQKLFLLIFWKAVDFVQQFLLAFRQLHGRRVCKKLGKRYVECIAHFFKRRNWRLHVFPVPRWNRWLRQARLFRQLIFSPIPFQSQFSDFFQNVHNIICFEFSFTKIKRRGKFDVQNWLALLPNFQTRIFDILIIFNSEENVICPNDCTVFFALALNFNSTKFIVDK